MSEQMMDKNIAEYFEVKRNEHVGPQGKKCVNWNIVWKDNKEPLSTRYFGRQISAIRWINRNGKEYIEKKFEEILLINK